MSATNSHSTAWWWRIGCWIFGHQFFVVQEFSKYSRRIYCPCCGLDQAMNDDVRVVVPWDKDFEEMYRSMGHTIREINK